MRTPFRSIPALRLLAAICAPAGLFLITPDRASAQGDVVPKDLVAVIQEVSDLESLRALNPLNLTAEQVGKIAEEIRKAGANHMKKVTAAAMPLQGMAKEISELRKRLLTGGEIPEEFDARGRKIQDQFVAKREVEKNKTLKALSDGVRAVLTPAQVAKVITLSKTLTKRDGKQTLQGTDDQFFNFWIQAVLIDYPGILPLLDEIKKAKEAAGTGASVSPKSDGSKVARK
jgi:hypothetical protein